MYVQPELKFDPNDDTYGQDTLSVPTEEFVQKLIDQTVPSGTTYEQLQYADYMVFLNELSESLGSFWINPTWWIPEAENPVISNAWELNTLKGFGELTEVKGSWNCLQDT